MKTNLWNQKSFSIIGTKSWPLVLGFILMLLNACEKDNYNILDESEQNIALSKDLENATDESITEPTREDFENAVAIDLPEQKEEKDQKDAIGLRTNYQPFHCEYDVHVGYHQWRTYAIRRSQLPDPMRWKIKVVLKSYGDADLYCHGYSQHHGRREIRHGVRRGHDLEEYLTCRLTDLYGHEDYLYISVWGYRESKFKLCFYYYPVECQEYPAAEQVVPQIYQPVCGCDGRDYGNAHAARAAGITYWTQGRCQGHGNCNYYFEDYFDNYHYGYVGPQSRYWTTWNYQDGGREDCEVVSSSNSSRGKILKIYDDNPHQGGHGYQNIIRKLGNLQHGKYELEWDMYVKHGYRAFYTLQHREQPGEYACSVVFWYNGTVKLIIGKYNYNQPIQHQNYVRDMPYHHNQWFKVKHIIDLDNGRIGLYINGQHLYSWDFHRGYPNNHLNQLGALNFKGFDRTKFYIDNLKLKCIY